MTNCGPGSDGFLGVSRKGSDPEASRAAFRRILDRDGGGLSRSDDELPSDLAQLEPR